MSIPAKVPLPTPNSAPLVSGDRPGVLMVGNYLSAWMRSRAVSEDLSTRLQGRGWRVIETSRRRAALPRLADMLATTWRHRKAYGVAHIDVFSGRAFIWAEMVASLLSLLRRPFVLTLRGGNLPDFATRHPLRVKRLLRAAHSVTTPSPYLQERLGHLRHDLLLLPNPLELKLYPYRNRASPEPHLLWMRSFHRLYNPALAPAVLALLLPSYPEARLLMVGPDKGDGSVAEVTAVMERLGVSDRVTLRLGVAKEEVPEWISRGDIYLNTPLIDNTPVTVLEALACGLCVVATDVGGIAYLLRHERNALLVPSDDAEAMEAAVRRLLEEPGLAASLSQTGRESVASCDWSDVLPRWESLLTDAAGNHRRDTSGR